MCWWRMRPSFLHSAASPWEMYTEATQNNRRQKSTLSERIRLFMEETQWTRISGMPTNRAGNMARSIYEKGGGQGRQLLLTKKCRWQGEQLQVYGNMIRLLMALAMSKTFKWTYILFAVNQLISAVSWFRGLMKTIYWRIFILAVMKRKFDVNL